MIVISSGSGGPLVALFAAAAAPQNGLARASRPTGIDPEALVRERQLSGNSAGGRIMPRVDGHCFAAAFVPAVATASGLLSLSFDELVPNHR